MEGVRNTGIRMQPSLCMLIVSLKWLPGFCLLVWSDFWYIHDTIEGVFFTALGFFGLLRREYVNTPSSLRRRLPAATHKLFLLEEGRWKITKQIHY